MKRKEGRNGGNKDGTIGGKLLIGVLFRPAND